MKFLDETLVDITELEFILITKLIQTCNIAMPASHYFYHPGNVGGDIAILPSTTLEIAPEASAVSVYMEVIDDPLAENSESTEIEVTASITRTPILQKLQTKVTIHDNEGTKGSPLIKIRKPDVSSHCLLFICLDTVYVFA